MLRRLGLTAEAVDRTPQIAPLLKQIGVLPARLIEVLRVDEMAESMKVVALWDKLTPANRNLLGLEALSLAAGLTPRRLWELYSGANLMQSRESVGAMLADALPSIVRKTIKEARKGKPWAMEHAYKATRVLPTPKGSVINIGVPSSQGELESGEEDQGGMLEGADDFLMRASRAMGAKALSAPAQPEILEPVTEDDEEGE